MKVSFLLRILISGTFFLQYGEQGLPGPRRSKFCDGCCHEQKHQERERGGGPALETHQSWCESWSLPSRPAWGAQTVQLLLLWEKERAKHLSYKRGRGKHHYEIPPSLPKEQLCPHGQADLTPVLQVSPLTLNASVPSRQFGRFHQWKDSRSSQSCPWAQWRWVPQWNQ